MSAETKNVGLIPEEVAVKKQPGEVIDVWLRFDSPEDEEPSHEANVYRLWDGFRVRWYHTAVGLVTSKWFRTYPEAQEFLTAGGYQDFSS